MGVPALNKLMEDTKFRYLVSIIIPFYNHIEMTHNCLEALIGTTPNLARDGKFLYEILLVDDCSTESYDSNRFCNHDNNVQLIRNGHNLGFAKSCNNGAAKATGQYLVFLNNDTIALKGWLENLIWGIASDPLVGIVGSKLLYSDDTIQHAGVAFDNLALPFHIYSGLPSSFRGANKKREFQAVTGACFIIEASLFNKMGRFDEAYLNGLEDIDLCLCVGKAGYKIIYCPASCLYHLESQTRKPTNKENIKIFHDRWNGKYLTDYPIYYKEDLSKTDEDLPDEFAELIRRIKTSIISNRTTVAVWGAGRGGSRAVEFLNLLAITTDLIIDSDVSKKGSNLDGIIIDGPESLMGLKRTGQSVFVFIASMWYAEITDSLMRLGFAAKKDFVRIT